MLVPPLTSEEPIQVLDDSEPKLNSVYDLLPYTPLLNHDVIIFVYFRAFCEAPLLPCGQKKSICATLNVFKMQLHAIPSHLTNMDWIVNLDHFHENLIISLLSYSPDAVHLLSQAALADWCCLHCLSVSFFDCVVKTIWPMLSRAKQTVWFLKKFFPVQILQLKYAAAAQRRSACTRNATVFFFFFF